MKEELLRLDRITVVSEGSRLLDSLSMHLFTGEILGLIPIDVQGLEELIDLIQHNNPISYGYVWFFEEVVNDYRRERTSANPVAVLEKQSRLIGSMNVTDNIFVVRGGMRKFLINDRTLADQLRRLCAPLNMDIPTDVPVNRLPLLTRWVVELLKAVVSGARLIIVRDISNTASPIDLEQMHRIIHQYAEKGLSFLYVCNHHEEVFSLCDRAVLMENGRIVKTLLPDQMNGNVMSRYAQSFTRFVSDHPRISVQAQNGEGSEAPALRVKHLAFGSIRDLTLTVQSGECVVLLDLDNSFLVPFVALLRSPRDIRQERNRITVAGVPLAKAGRLYAMIDEKPTRSTLFRDLSYLDNLCFLADDKLRLFWTRRRYRQSIRSEYLPLVGPVIDAPSLAGLSLHDLYELVYHRIRLQHPRVVFCIQPFAGVDMYQRLRIIQLIDMLRQQHIAVVSVAVSLSDSLQVADWLLVVQNGTVVRRIGRERFSSIDSSPPSKE